MSQFRTTFGEEFRSPILTTDQNGDGEHHHNGGSHQDEMTGARRELETLRDRQRQIMELIGCANADRLVHDLRNLLNEMQLLRMLNDLDKQH